MWSAATWGCLTIQGLAKPCASACQTSWRTTHLQAACRMTSPLHTGWPSCWRTWRQHRSLTPGLPTRGAFLPSSPSSSPPPRTAGLGHHKAPLWVGTEFVDSSCSLGIICSHVICVGVMSPWQTLNVIPCRAAKRGQAYCVHSLLLGFWITVVAHAYHCWLMSFWICAVKV